MKTILCLSVAGTCLVSPQYPEVNVFSTISIPTTITFNREVIQQMHGDEGTRTMTYYFSLDGDYAAMKPDPKSNMEMSLMVYGKDGTALMFNDRQKTITVVKIAGVRAERAKKSNEVTKQLVYRRPTNDKENIIVTVTGKTKNICGYLAFEYEMKSEGGKALWYFAKVDFNPIKIYTMGIPVLDRNYLLVEMSSTGGAKDMETKSISRKKFIVSTSGYKIIDLCKKGQVGMAGKY